MKWILGLAILTFSLITSAQVVIPRDDNSCASPNQLISAQQLGELLKAAPAINGCSIYEVTYFESLVNSGYETNDGYVGPTLFVRVIDSSNNFKFKNTLLVIRGNKPLCLEKKTEQVHTITYHFENSKGEGLWTYLSGDQYTYSNSVTLQFTDNALSRAEDIHTTQQVGMFNGDKQSEVFKCGSSQASDTTVKIP